MKMETVLLTTTYLILIAVVLIVPKVLLADDFNVSLTVLGDLDAPTVPTNLTATAVSSTRVDLSWSASTDNVAVVGYNIYRDNTFLTSTSNTSYSDTGLISNTTYTYSVSAYDAIPNESANSSEATVITPTSGGASGGSTPAKAFDIDVYIDTNIDSAVITWTTDLPAKTKIKWGRDMGVSEGTILDPNLENDHKAVISALNPQTKYYFVIESTNALDIVSEYSGEFRTDVLKELVPNVTGLKARAVGDDIVLEWQNPEASQFEGVWISRSDKFFPTDRMEGKMVYEGDGESFVDNSVSKDKTYYYSVFSYDEDGRYSSGSLVSVSVGEAKRPILGVIGTPHEKIEKLELDDIKVFQDGELKKLKDGHISISGNKNTTLLFEYEDVPEVLKAIVVELVDAKDENKSFSFLLRINEDKTAYTATIGPLGQSGQYKMYVQIFDYKNQGVKILEGSLIASTITYIDAEGVDSKFMKFLPGIFGILILIIIGAIRGIRMIFRSKREYA